MDWIKHHKFDTALLCIYLGLAVYFTVSGDVVCALLLVALSVVLLADYVIEGKDRIIDILLESIDLLMKDNKLLRQQLEEKE